MRGQKPLLLLVALMTTFSRASANNSVWLRGEGRATGNGCRTRRNQRQKP